MATPIRSRKTRSDGPSIDVTPAKLELGGVRHRREVVKPVRTPSKAVVASLAALATPVRDGSPASKTPELKKVRTPEKEKSAPSPVESSTILKDKPDLPVHYKRLVDDQRLLDETLAIFRVQNQIPFFTILRGNIERVSGRRFTLDHFRQLMTATEGALFKAEWQQMKDSQGKATKYDLTIRAIDHEKDGSEIFKRLSVDQSKSRIGKISDFLDKKLSEYIEKCGGIDSCKLENAYPIKPFELPAKPREDAETVIGADGTPSTPVSGRNRVLSKCDSVASDGSTVRTPKSSLRRQLSVSASPVVPNVLPQFVAASTPVKLASSAAATPMSAKDRLQAIRDRVKAKEEKDVEDAKQYDLEMEKRAKLDEFDFAIKLLIKLNHKFPRGIDSAKLSTLKKDYGSLFVHADDVEKWTKKICELVPHRFELSQVAEESVLRYKTADIKFSVIKKEIEDMKSQFATSVRE